MSSEAFGTYMKRYSDFLGRRYNSNQIDFAKMTRLFSKHRQWIATAQERGIYNG